MIVTCGEDFEVFQKEVESFLQTTEAKSKSDIDDKRKYKDLLNCGFKLTNVVRIENTSPYDESIVCLERLETILPRLSTI